MNIAILGATSNIAKDLIINLITRNPEFNISLFSRNITHLNTQLDKQKIINEVTLIGLYEDFLDKENYDVIFNFVGIGDPAKAIKMGASIIDITYEYDSLAIDYIKKNPSTKYFFLSSGAVYGSENFSNNVNNQSEAHIKINDIKPQDWYSIAKLHAECRHRSLVDKSIVDIRVFNYINSSLDINSRFLITDALRALMSNQNFKTSQKNIIRDYIGPDDFYKLVISLIFYGEFNDSVDCYTKSPIDKFSMLNMLEKEFGLNYQINDSVTGLNATGTKDNYYSKNYRAERYGYKPEFTSLETIHKEVTLILQKNLSSF
jgi:nucleoside-diphosphate-sugar epimerase